MIFAQTKSSQILLLISVKANYNLNVLFFLNTLSWNLHKRIAPICFIKVLFNNWKIASNSGFHPR